MIKCLLQFLSQTQLDCNSFLLNKTIRDSFPPQLEIEADGITSWIDDKGEKRTDGLVPDPPLVQSRHFNYFPKRLGLFFPFFLLNKNSW
jgi:hypothetical protein